MVGSLLRLHSRCSRVTRFSRFSVEPRSRGIARGRPTARDGTSSHCYCGNVTRTGRAWPAFAASHQCYRFSVDLISKQSWHWRTSAQASRPSSCCARRAAALAGRAAPGFQSSARARPWSLQSPGSLAPCHAFANTAISPAPAAIPDAGGRARACATPPPLGYIRLLHAGRRRHSYCRHRRRCSDGRRGRHRTRRRLCSHGARWPISVAAQDTSRTRCRGPCARSRMRACTRAPSVYASTSRRSCCCATARRTASAPEERGGPWALLPRVTSTPCTGSASCSKFGTC